LSIVTVTIYYEEHAGWNQVITADITISVAYGRNAAAYEECLDLGAFGNLRLEGT
jgi:hypothetical protein